MKWSYKVIPVDELIHEYADHDIAVSKEAAARRRATLATGFEQKLNLVGEDGWELVAILGEFGVFKKPKNE
ncbi:hypothetical protein HRbin37_00758 [bacterium HR37]|nr:hypothetical protein HRbin37_00758 [bacterium HR37]